MMEQQPGGDDIPDSGASALSSRRITIRYPVNRVGGGECSNFTLPAMIASALPSASATPTIGPISP
jgi:hypothetical protein